MMKPTRAALLVCGLWLCAEPAAAFDSDLYAQLLESHTRNVPDLARVRVDYPALAASADWDRLVESLATTDLAKVRTREEKLALWINAYNILAIDLVATHHPVESIRDIGSFFSPVWKKPAGRVGGRTVTLDEIEHEIVRPIGEPRVHAVVICASTSCPALPREPLRADILDAQLDAATRAWVADPGKGMKIDRVANSVRLSKIFDWFEEDFEEAGGVLAFVARHAPEPDQRWLREKGEAVRIVYFDYDWALNGLER